VVQWVAERIMWAAAVSIQSIARCETVWNGDGLEPWISKGL
jgi:hypothetical protein